MTPERLAELRQLLASISGGVEPDLLAAASKTLLDTDRLSNIRRLLARIGDHADCVARDFAAINALRVEIEKVLTANDHDLLHETGAFKDDRAPLRSGFHLYHAIP